MGVMKIGFIGTGNMANAIIKGVVKSGNMTGKDIYVYDIDTSKCDKCAVANGVMTTNSVDELIDNVNAVLLAVKPNVFPVLLPQITDKLSKKNPLIISIAAGKTLQFIEDQLNFNPSLIRVMPNINAIVGEAMSAYCTNGNVSGEQEALVKGIFGSVGQIIPLDESYFPLFGVISGSAPAFAYMFIDSLARSAVKNGMNKKAALNIAAQTVLGSAEMILKSDEHPWELIDKVCSPGGTTIEGVVSLQESGFDAAVIKAADAAVNKDKNI